MVSFHKFKFCSPKIRAPEGALVVNTTSVSRDFGIAFSPMIAQGDIELGGLKAHNVENCWQFLKVYECHAKQPKEWVQWRDNGLANVRGVRYPMGKGAKPKFSYLTKELGRLGYIDARKQIYVPAYRQKLDKYCQRQVNTLIDMLTVKDVWLWDFDVRPLDEGVTFDMVLNNPEHPLGHGFVLSKYVSDKILEAENVQIWE